VLPVVLSSRLGTESLVRKAVISGREKQHPISDYMGGIDCSGSGLRLTRVRRVKKSPCFLSYCVGMDYLGRSGPNLWTMRVSG